MADNTFIIAGSRFYFKRDSVGSTHYPLHDLGVVSEVTPNVDPTTAELRDPFQDNAIVDQKSIQVDRSFEFTLRDFNADLLAYILFGVAADLSVTGADVNTVSQAAADVHHGHLLQIKDANGVPVTRLTSVDEIVLADDTATTEGDDWEVVDLDTGLIRIIDGGDIVTGNAIKVSYTTTTFAGKRIAVDQNPLVQGSGVFVVRGRANAWRSKYDQVRMNLIPTSLALPSAEHASYGLRATILSTAANVGFEQGRFDVIRGA